MRHLVELMKLAEFGKVTNFLGEKHLCISLVYNDFRLIVNGTSSSQIKFNDFGIKVACHKSAHITEIKNFSVPQLVDFNAKQLIFHKDPRFVYLHFLAAGDNDEYTPKDTLIYRIKMIRGLVETLNSPKIQSVIVMRDPDKWDIDFEYMHFKGGIFSKSKGMAEELVGIDKYFNDPAFLNSMQFIADSDTIIQQIDRSLEVLKNGEVGELLKELGVTDVATIKLFENEDYSN